MGFECRCGGLPSIGEFTMVSYRCACMVRVESPIALRLLRALKVGEAETGQVRPCIVAHILAASLSWLDYRLALCYLQKCRPWLHWSPGSRVAPPIFVSCP